jgi:hypothetical protein
MAKMVNGSQTEGKRRFSGVGVRGKWDPRPGTVEWYKANMADRFNTTMLNIKSAGYEQAFAEQAAARVLAWNERPLSKIPFPLPDKCFACGSGLIHKD